MSRRPRQVLEMNTEPSPETELMSHYFQAVLPMQFDEYVWFEETNAIEPIEAHEVQCVPETYPFGV